MHKTAAGNFCLYGCGLLAKSLYGFTFLPDLLGLPPSYFPGAAS
jgi:hypothetical protein